MKLFTHFAIISAVVASVLSAPTTGTAVVQVVAELDTINNQVVALTQLTVNFNGTAAAALPIENGAISLIRDTNAVVSLLKAIATPLSITDGTTVLNVVKNGEPNIEACLSAIVSQRAALVKLSLQATVHATLVNLNISVQTLITALVAVAPPSLKSESTALGVKVTTSLTAAIAAYAA